MSRMDEFRKFVSTHGLIKNEVLSGKKTWQQIYEDWVILGESDKSFDIYRTADFKSDQENKSNTNTTSKQTKQFKLEDLFASENIKTIINYVKKERLEFVPFMSMMYQEIYRKDKNIVLSKVITARKLKSEALEALRQKVSKSTGKQVVMYDETNEDLIGGFVLELNNLRYDASVKASLEKIESKLTGK